MVGIGQLWLPIVVSAVIVFVMSSIIHMVLPWHKGDYPALADQDRIMDALRPFNLQPGDYMLPRPKDMADMKSAEFKEKATRGPKVVMTVMPSGMPGMGSNLAQWFVYLLVVSFFAAYITGHALGAGANYLQVFRFAGATSFMAYALGEWPLSIWYRRGWRLAITGTLDGLIYACLTAGTFGWLWPR
ncbi:MAG: hypothetical protein ACRENQ_12770 [Gemmatimonadaceae bacterium]